MSFFQSGRFYSSASSQTYWRSAFLLVFVSLLTLATSCSDEDGGNDEPMLKGVVSMYNEYDGAMLDFTEDDMLNAGFSLGDVISVTLDGKTFVVPYYDGYYARKGELLCVAYPACHSLVASVGDGRYGLCGASQKSVAFLANTPEHRSVESRIHILSTLYR